jgi:NhaA family Na+:H+ antiporter
MPENRHELPRAQLFAERFFSSVERVLHIEAVSGIVLLTAAIVALVWANSPFSETYQHIWHAPVTIGIGSMVFSHTLHFWINDILMTIFFLVVGMEIRREIHQGALKSLAQASLPVIAAIGGVVVPAIVYLAFNADPSRHHGWAVPAATDIAFALGVLALFGRAIPGALRIFLLALAVIDDIIAVLIIAFFYTDGFNFWGFAVAAPGILIILLLQTIGVGSAWIYIIPGAIVWSGILMTGAHPALAGVLLGMMTPVVAVSMRERPVELLSRISRDLLKRHKGGTLEQDKELSHSARQLRIAQRELLPPVVRVQQTLHPWVSYTVMPLFALANAGVNLGEINLAVDGAVWVALGITLALVIGKPLGVIGTCWLLVRLRVCRLPENISWRGLVLVASLTGIGFTMSIFIAMLAFVDANLLGAAKLGVLTGSGIMVIISIICGFGFVRKYRVQQAASAVSPQRC